jgi:hypothetical protein
VPASQLHNQGGSAYVQIATMLELMGECLTDFLSVAQGWSYKACPVKEHDSGRITVRIAIFFMVLTTLCVGGRFLARWCLPNAHVGIDDWSVLISFLFIIPATILIILSEWPQLKFPCRPCRHADITPLVAKNGMGRDIWTVPPDDVTSMLKVEQLPFSNRLQVANEADAQNHRISTSPRSCTNAPFL